MRLPLVVQAQPQRDGWTVFEVAGELDLSTFAVLDEQHRIHTRQETPVRLDLRQVSFIDSSGLAAVILAKKRADEHRVPFEIAEASDVVRRAFRLAAIEDWLKGGPEEQILRLQGRS